MRFAAGQADAEGCALSFLAFRLNLPAAKLQNPVNQRKPQTVSGGSVGGILLIEFIKNMGNMLRPDSDSLIPYPYGDVGILFFCPDVDGAAFVAEFHGIADEVHPDMIHHFQIISVGKLWHVQIKQEMLCRPLTLQPENAGADLFIQIIRRLLCHQLLIFIMNALSSMIENDDTPGFENVVDIRFAGKETYTIDRIEDSGYSYSDADVYFVQQNGKYLPLDKSAVTRYLNTITSLNLTDYVTYNATEEELASYGLDEPELSVTVNYTYTDEASEEQIADTCVIHIGRDPEQLQAAQEAEEKGETAGDVAKYVRVGDSQIVYALDSVDYGILSNASYNDLRHKEVFWADFEDVSQE